MSFRDVGRAGYSHLELLKDIEAELRKPATRDTVTVTFACLKGLVGALILEEEIAQKAATASVKNIPQYIDTSKEIAG